MQTTPPVRPSIAIALVTADQARLACGRRWYPTSTERMKTGGGSRLLEIPPSILAISHFGTRRVKMGGGSRLLEIPPPILATSHFKTGAPYSRRFCKAQVVSRPSKKNRMKSTFPPLSLTNLLQFFLAKECEAIVALCVCPFAVAWDRWTMSHLVRPIINA